MSTETLIVGVTKARVVATKYPQHLFDVGDVVTLLEDNNSASKYWQRDSDGRCQYLINEDLELLK